MMEVYQAGETVYHQFNTRDGDGAPITWAGSPAVAVRKDAATATTTDGVSLVVDSGSVTGLHTLTIDTSQNGTFYATGHEFSVIVTAGTVDGTSVVGEVVLRFRLGEVPADVQAAATAALNAYDPPTKAEMDAAISSRLAAVDYVEPPTVEEIDAELTTNHGDGSWGPPAGSRANTYTVYESDGITPMAGCEVWATSDDAGAHEISNRGLTTDAGKHVFYFDLAAGTTVYIWRRKSGKSFTNPDAEVVA